MTRKTTKKSKPRLAVIDAETDPFLYGRKPEVFAWGFFDGVKYQDFWGAHATAQLLQYLERESEPLMIYAHNGGKFDFFYLIEQGVVNDPITIINGRIVKLGLGEHELRDSYAIIPVALAVAGDKLEIDYEKFEASQRQKHKAEILHYLAVDCEALYKLVSRFHERFGPMLTVGGTAIKELEKLHPLKRGDAEHDAAFRPFYYGGRVSCFEPGIHRGDFTVYDVNSMYPHVMRNREHPYGMKYLRIDSPELDRLGNVKGYAKRPYFAKLTATNRSALPVRTDEGLYFDAPEGEFFACSHEIKVALKHKLIDVHEISHAFVPLQTITFDAFVDTFIADKISAKLSGDKIAELFAKFMLNSAYGKFGQNPAHYFDYSILRTEERPAWMKKHKGEEWAMHLDFGDWEIWKKPTPKPRYFDVAIAASITSAARSVLLDALQTAKRPIYCDTDSIICESLPQIQSDTELGAWKIEAQGDRIGIAGKKLYALYKGRQCVKMASKGADLEPGDIVSLARGNAVIWAKDAPTFRLGAPAPLWIDRVIIATA